METPSKNPSRRPINPQHETPKQNERKVGNGDVIGEERRNCQNIHNRNMKVDISMGTERWR
jgi:hypothetical protein